MQQVKAHGEAARQTTAQRGTYATKLTKEASSFFALLVFPATLPTSLAKVYTPPTVPSERKEKRKVFA